MPTITDPRIAHEYDDILDAPVNDDWVWCSAAAGDATAFEILYPQRGPVLLNCGCYERECTCEDKLRDTTDAIVILLADTKVTIAQLHAEQHGGILAPTGHCAECDRVR